MDPRDEHLLLFVQLVAFWTMGAKFEAVLDVIELKTSHHSTASKLSARFTTMGVELTIMKPCLHISSLLGYLLGVVDGTFSWFTAGLCVADCLRKTRPQPFHSGCLPFLRFWGLHCSSTFLVLAGKKKVRNLRFNTIQEMLNIMH